MDTASGNNKICDRSNPEMCVMLYSTAPSAARDRSKSIFAWRRAASRQGGRTRSEADARQRDVVFSGLAGIGPKDTLEAMIAAQMLACHGAAIECFRYALATNRAPVAL